MADPRPCPFCGSTRVQVQTGECRGAVSDEPRLEYWITCFGCAAEGPWSRTEAGAVRMWNMREADRG